MREDTYIKKQINYETYLIRKGVPHLFPKFKMKNNSKKVVSDFENGNINNISTTDKIIEIHEECYQTDLWNYLEEGNITTLQELNTRLQLGYDIATRITQMIEELHNFGYIHGDLHCGNIVINIDTNEIKDIRFIDIDTPKFSYKIDFLKHIDNFDYRRQVLVFWGIADMSNITEKMCKIENIIAYEKIQWKGVLNNEIFGPSIFGI